METDNDPVGEEFSLCGVVEATIPILQIGCQALELILTRTTPHNLIMVTAGFHSWRQESVNSVQDRNGEKTFHMTSRTPMLSHRNTRWASKINMGSALDQQACANTHVNGKSHQS